MDEGLRRFVAADAARKTLYWTVPRQARTYPSSSVVWLWLGGQVRHEYRGMAAALRQA